MNDGAYYYPNIGQDRLIHIVDGDTATCEALSVLFRLEGFQTVFSIDAAQFAVNLERRRPDACIINLHVGEESGLTLLRRVRAVHPNMPVFMLGEQPQLSDAVTAMKLGAADVVAKPVDTEALLNAVRDVLKIDRAPVPILIDRRPVEIRGFAQLTPREREVLQLIAHGQSNKEAGRELGISPRTVEVHRARVMEKLGAKNTADLMRIVLAG